MIEDYKKVFKDPPVLETERLLLRPLSVSDAKDMYEYSSREEVTRYLLYSPHESLEYTERYLNYLKNQYKQGLFVDWAVVLKESGKMIGTGGYTWMDEKNQSGEIGYVLSNDYWGKGYATEIAEELLSFGFNYLGANRLQARYIVGNDKSRHVMEKIGMLFEGVARSQLFVKGTFKDIGSCAILQEEYFKNHERKVYRFDEKNNTHWYDRLW